MGWLLISNVYKINAVLIINKLFKIDLAIFTSSSKENDNLFLILFRSMNKKTGITDDKTNRTISGIKRKKSQVTKI